VNVPPLTSYTKFTRAELIHRLSYVLEDLAREIQFYYDSRSQEVRAHAIHWQTADLSAGVTAIREAAKLSTFELTCEIQHTKGQLDVLELERDFLLLLLKERNVTVQENEEGVPEVQAGVA
jgi:hypothetical protein